MTNVAIQKVPSFNLSAAGSASIPANALIHAIVMKNLSGNAVTGGIKIGTSVGGTDVVAAQTVGANALTYVTDAATLKRIFSDIAAQTLYFDAVTGWNSAVVSVTILYIQI